MEEDSKSRLNYSSTTPDTKDSKEAKKKGRRKRRGSAEAASPEKQRNASSKMRPPRQRYMPNDVFYDKAPSDGERPAAAYKVVQALGSVGCRDLYLVKRDDKARFALKTETTVEAKNSRTKSKEETAEVQPVVVPSPVKKPVSGVRLKVEILTELAKLDTDKQRHFIRLIDKGEDQVHKMRITGKKAQFKGTPQFASRVCHRLEWPGPKDDLETWIFLFEGPKKKRGSRSATKENEEAVEPSREPKAEQPDNNKPEAEVKKDAESKSDASPALENDGQEEANSPHKEQKKQKTPRTSKTHTPISPETPVGGKKRRSRSKKPKRKHKKKTPSASMEQ